MAPFLQHPKTQSTKMTSSGSPRISIGFLPQATSSMKAPKANTSVYNSCEQHELNVKLSLDNKIFNVKDTWHTRFWEGIFNLLLLSCPKFQGHTEAKEDY
ncbi:hypothetical protein CFP56_005052 [Quercus suber]|uniref:Uncharacterized protein n=1 Tax=Quercus suber TaxID=58331 RepID=A0AAW0IH02_QUESU